MIDQAPTHRAPQGIVLGVGIMILFYLALWMAIRACFSAPSLQCHAIPASATALPKAMCKPDTGGACLCATH